MNPNYISGHHIKVNGITKCHSYGDSAGVGDYNAQSCAIVISLSLGDEIYITSTNGDAVHGTSGFAGFLIRPYI